MIHHLTKDELEHSTVDLGFHMLNKHGVHWIVANKVMQLHQEPKDWLVSNLPCQELDDSLRVRSLDSQHAAVAAIFQTGGAAKRRRLTHSVDVTEQEFKPILRGWQR